MINIILALIILFLSVIDIILTNKILSNGGKELNPLMKWCMDKFGSRWWIPKMVITSFLVLGLLQYKILFPFIVAGIAQLGIVIWNIKELKK